MQSYPYTDITCNGRRVSISEIITGSARASNSFEESLFTFISQWLNGQETFALTTSGSTGPPKKIYVSRLQMIASAHLTTQVLKLEAGQTALVCLSPEFIAGKMMIVRCLEIGMAIVAVNPSSNPLKGITQTIDFVAMVPLQVHDELLADINSFQNVGTVIIGGGAIDANDAGAMKNMHCRFFATYGMTETVSHVALRPLNGEHASEYFKALPGISFSLDARDCMTVHWPGFADSLVTNDLVELLDKNHFRWLGRWDNVINSGGRKIIPETLESTIAAVMRNLGQHVRFFISSVPDARLGNKVILVLEGEHTNQNYSKLRSALQSSLQSFEVPKAFLSYSRFIETQTGKIDRTASLKLALSHYHSSE